MTDALTIEKIAELEALIVAASKTSKCIVSMKVYHGLLDAAPALIAMARRCDELSNDLFELRNNIDHPADGCACRRNPRTDQWPHECMFHQKIRERAEKAEAESARYREMAVRLAQKLAYLDKHFLAITPSELKEPDIAALLEENSHG